MQNALFAAGLVAGLAGAVIVERKTRNIDLAMLTYWTIALTAAVILA